MNMFLSNAIMTYRVQIFYVTCLRPAQESYNGLPPIFKLFYNIAYEAVLNFYYIQLVFSMIFCCICRKFPSFSPNLCACLTCIPHFKTHQDKICAHFKVFGYSNFYEIRDKGQVMLMGSFYCY